MSYKNFGLAGFAAAATLLSAPLVHADPTIEVDMYQATADGQGAQIGTITLEENRYGVLISPSVEQLSPGPHGFHLHENPDCGPQTENGETKPAGAAGGHYDPDDTGSHQGPYDPNGHLGDLPRIYAGEDGKTEQSYLAPRLQLADFQGRALVIHEGADNYGDNPRPLGGGGARVACGVVSTE